MDKTTCQKKKHIKYKLLYDTHIIFDLGTTKYVILLPQHIGSSVQ